MIATYTDQILLKELDLLQGCINRMSQNSFQIKGWFLTLVTATIALFSAKIQINILSSLMLIITLSFWYIDATYLQSEQRFRMKYEWVITERPKGNTQYLYDLNPMRKETRLPDAKDQPIKEIMKSKSLRPLYGSIALISIFPNIILIIQKIQLLF